MTRLIYLFIATLGILNLQSATAQETYDYPDKDLWYDTTIYGGHTCAANIVTGNGSEGFDVEEIINSEMGEQMMYKIKNELVIYGGDNWDHPEMTQYWADRGVIKDIYNVEDRTHAWITYMPDYMEKSGNKKYPVVFSAHGGGGTLFESENHGFVHLCHEKGFIVVAPENENTQTIYSAEKLGDYLNEMEEMGYPIDRTRVYYTGMSMGGVASMYIGLTKHDVVAAVAAHSSPRMLDRSTSGMFEALLTEDMYNTGTQVPMWVAVGEYDSGQLPLANGIIEGFNSWLKMNGCSPASSTADNMLGLTADDVSVEKIYDKEYTFAKYYNKDGVMMNEFIGVEDHPHWVTPNFAESAWEFMSKFSRAKNGELIINE